MRLSRLELLGFKSFFYKTIFRFGGGITTIVGPNGCGKSNIVDAIIWVLGERGLRSLRVRDMEDVIFHGSDIKKPLGFAEVTIEFLLDDERELSVKRRIFRDGTNEYFINDRAVRLKDISQFFLGTGIGLNSYAIVEQGKVEAFIQMKPHERRILIEETSGITRFEEKKVEVLARMEEVRENLRRIEDLYGEIKRSLEKAKLEWERWKRWKEITGRLQEIEREILKEGLRRIERKIGKIKEGILFLEREFLEKKREKEEIERLKELKKNEFLAQEGFLRQLELEIKEKEKTEEKALLELEYLKSEEKRLRDQEKELQRELMEIKKRQQKEKDRMDSLLKEIEKEDQEIKRLAIRTNEEEEYLKKERERLKEMENLLDKKKTELFVISVALSEIKNRLNDFERSLKEEEIRKKRRKEEAERLKEAIGKNEERKRFLSEKAEHLKKEMEKLNLEESSLMAKRESLLKAANEKRVLIKSLEGERDVRKRYLERLKPEERLKGEKRLIDLLASEEKDESYEGLLTRELDYIVIEQEDPFLISKIAKDRGGGIVFFGSKSLFKLDSFGLRLDVKKRETLEEVLHLIRGGDEGVFYADGFYIDSRGFIHKKEERGYIKRHKEILKTEKEIEALGITIEKEAGLLKKIEEEINYIESFLKEKVKEKRQKEREKVLIEEEIGRLRLELDSQKKRVLYLSEEDLFEPKFDLDLKDKLEREKEEKEEERKKCEEEFQLLKERFEELKRTHESRSLKWHKDVVELEKRKKDLASKEEERKRLERALELEKEKETRMIMERESQGKRILEIKNRTESIEKGLEKIHLEKEKSLSLFEELSKGLSIIKENQKSLEEKSKEIEKEIEKIREKKDSLEKERLIFEEKRNLILERLQNISEEELSLGEEISLSKLERERDELLKERELLGEINFRAEKEFEELKERSSFIEREKRDLEVSLESLRKTITRIENYSKEAFLSTFYTVNETFKIFIERLFSGGKGYLRLDDETKGVEMFVQPKGKKIVRMESLSGGEKTLASLSFLLSLIDTKPAPFCIFDEVDAALDDPNILRLREILKDLGKKTQIILITHNRLTIEISETLYGITMEEDGISKVVSAKI